LRRSPSFRLKENDMPSTTNEASLQIMHNGTVVALGGDSQVFMDEWCVQVRTTLQSGAERLVLWQQYTINRGSGAVLANMYCDEIPAQASGPLAERFVAVGGIARFSNHKRANGSDALYRPDKWTFGTAL
jgi:hypothetical protein